MNHKVAVTDLSSGPLERKQFVAFLSVLRQREVFKNFPEYVFAIRLRRHKTRHVLQYEYGRAMGCENVKILAVKIMAGINFVFRPVLSAHSYTTHDGIRLTRWAANENPNFLSVQGIFDSLVYLFCVFFCEFKTPCFLPGDLGLLVIPSPRI